MDDRRSDERINIMGFVKLYIAGQKKGHEAYLNNISPGGMGVYIHRKLELGRKITIELMFKNNEGKAIAERITAHIVWIKKAHDFNMLGIKFEGIEDELYKKIINNFQGTWKSS